MATRKIVKSAQHVEDIDANEVDKVETIENVTSIVPVEDTDFTFNLLAGYVDKDGVTHVDFELREMTGRDEEAISKNDVKGNFCRAISVILARTCTRIGSLTPKSVGGYHEWEKIIKNLYSGDQDYMMVKLRQISFGDEITVEHTCPNPNCKRKLTTTLSVDELQIVPFKGLRKIPFSLPRGYVDRKGVVHKDGTMRLSTGLDREICIPIARNNVARGETSLLTRLCSFNDGLTIDDDIMASITVRDRAYLQRILTDNLFGIENNIDIVCPDCGTEFKGSLNAVNFI